MSLGSDLYSLLITNAAVAALVGTGVYPNMLPQEPAYPACTYFCVDAVPLINQDGDGLLDHGRWQVSCWATTYAGAVALATAVRAAMRGWRAAYGVPAQFAGWNDVPQPETGVYQRAVDFMIWHRE